MSFHELPSSYPGQPPLSVHSSSLDDVERLHWSRHWLFMGMASKEEQAQRWREDEERKALAQAPEPEPLSEADVDRLAERDDELRTEGRQRPERVNFHDS